MLVSLDLPPGPDAHANPATSRVKSWKMENILLPMSFFCGVPVNDFGDRGLNAFYQIFDKANF